MSRLHELIAVEADRQGQYKNILAETTKVFKDKNLFAGGHRKLEMFEEDGIKHPEERSNLASTVDQRLEYNNKSVIRYFDLLLQRDATNQEAVGDVIIDGKPIAEGLPATFLLGMESRLRELRAIYSGIPTLDQGINWKKDEGVGEGVWVIEHDIEQLKTAMQFKSQVLYKATVEHPAQIEKWEEQVPVGKYVKRVWSGMLTPARKSELLGRIDKLISAVKKARQRANSTTVVNRNVGKDFIKYITG